MNIRPQPRVAGAFSRALGRFNSSAVRSSASGLVTNLRAGQSLESAIFPNLKKNGALAPLRALMKRGRTTLLYSARDTEHNQVAALAEYLAKPAHK
jgi:hypothetical protein